MAVQRVGTRVELPVGEPAVERRVAVVEDLAAVPGSTSPRAAASAQNALGSEMLASNNSRYPPMPAPYNAGVAYRQRMSEVVKIAAVNGPDGAASGIAVITLNRPEKLNAIDGALIDGVDAALDGTRAACLPGGDPDRRRPRLLRRRRSERHR